MKMVKWAAMILFTGLVAFGFWRGLVTSDLTKVKNIEVEGATPETEARIRAALPVKVGDSLWAVPVEKTVHAIKEDSWVEAAEVRRQFPHTISITVSERKPFAVMNGGHGKFEFVDEANHDLGPAGADQIAPYPILTGNALEKDKDLRAQALDLLKTLPDAGPVSLSDINEIRFDDDHGYQFTLGPGGVVVDIGKNDLPLHIDRARRVVQYLTAHNINASHVDSDYAKKVLVKVRRGR